MKMSLLVLIVSHSDDTSLCACRCAEKLEMCREAGAVGARAGEGCLEEEGPVRRRDPVCQQKHRSDLKQETFVGSATSRFCSSTAGSKEVLGSEPQKTCTHRDVEKCMHIYTYTWRCAKKMVQSAGTVVEAPENL